MNEGVGSQFFTSLVECVARHAYKLENDMLKQKLEAWEQCDKKAYCSFCRKAFPQPWGYGWTCPEWDCHVWCGTCSQSVMHTCKECKEGYCDRTSSRCPVCKQTFCTECIDMGVHNHSEK